MVLAVNLTLLYADDTDLIFQHKDLIIARTTTGIAIFQTSATGLWIIS